MQQPLTLPQKPRIAMVGTGALGTYYGVRLAKSGLDVHFLSRSDYDAVKQNGYQLRFRKDEPVHLEKPNLHKDTADIGAVDWVIIGMKATGREALETMLPPLLHENTVILCLMNGMGHTEWLAERFGAHRVVGGLCFISLNRIAPGVVMSLYNGYLDIANPYGAAGQREHTVQKLFMEAGVKCNCFDAWNLALWRKLCWNVPFNGLAIAAGGVATDVITHSKPLSDFAQALMRELQAAAHAYGHEIDDEFLELQFTNTRKMGAYKPSSLVDYLTARQVEVDAIWAEPLRRGLAKSVPMPYLNALLNLIRSRVVNS